MKIKLTKEQLKIAAFTLGLSEFGHSVSEGLPVSATIEISESQIIHEKSNAEKWEEVFASIEYYGGFGSFVHLAASRLDRFGYDADKAYKEVCGG